MFLELPPRFSASGSFVVDCAYWAHLPFVPAASVADLLSCGGPVGCPDLEQGGASKAAGVEKGGAVQAIVESQQDLCVRDGRCLQRG